MYKAFIVDDDALALETISLSFDWKRLNIDSYEKIYNPHNLIERIITEKPHVVFIDIEIGDISGLDIIKECIVKNPSTIFIIISGHDNFRYAQTAVSLNVVYYLLKPLDPQDVEAATLKILNALSKQYENESVLQDDSNCYFSNKEDFENFFCDKLQFNNEIKYRFLICSLNERDYNNLNAYLSSLIIYSYRIGKRKYLYIINANAYDKSFEIILKNFITVKKIYVGLGKIFDSISEMYESFEMTNILFSNYFINKNQYLFCDGNINDDNFKSIIDRINVLIDLKKLTDVSAVLKSVPQTFLEEGFTTAHAVSFYNSIASRINILSYKENRTQILPPMNMEELLSEYDSFEIMCQEVQNQIEYVFNTKSICKMNNSQESSLWSKFTKFIESNYMKRISIQDVCLELCISKSNFYVFFKNHTGITFVEYLNNLRIEKAMWLLRHTNKPVSDIAEQVGIYDYYYFNKTFKKITGLTPLKYRKNGEEIK